MLRAIDGTLALTMTEPEEAIRMMEGVAGVLLRLADTKAEGVYCNDSAMFEMLATVLDDSAAVLSVDNVESFRLTAPSKVDG